jgi:hypothetical protein
LVCERAEEDGVDGDDVLLLSFAELVVGVVSVPDSTIVCSSCLSIFMVMTNDEMIRMKYYNVKCNKK